MANKWKAEWTGKYPCVCNGEWKLYKNEELVKTEIPFQGSSANTRNLYSKWHFGYNWNVEWEDYMDGLDEDEWIEEYREWLITLSDDECDWLDIYYAFEKEDWRGGSCGGCI